MSQLTNKLIGSIVAIVTPMQKTSYRIDYGKFQELINWHISQKTNGIVIAGSTGESSALESREFVKLLELAITTAKNKLSIIAGTGTCNANATIKKTLLAEKLGADATLVVTPYYSKPTQHGLVLYFEKLASTTKLPILLYNVPSRTGCDLLPTTVATLAKIKNIVGIKEATGKLDRVPELKKLCGEEFILLSGDDPTFVEFMLQGGSGVISVTANVCPQIISKICSIILNRKNLDIAKQLNSALDQLHRIMTIEANPIPVKWLLAHLGKIQEACRLPLTNLSKQYHQTVLEAYNNIKEFNKEGVYS
ncbi:MAG: 4-hydroxy-tetrahydrodipicolinate synthase [Gammaproteobacteria bacterium]|jgi:4-hydroxy-tetrahydrodipicolinate synthase